MKKLTTLVLFVLMSFILIACTDDQTPPNNEEEPIEYTVTFNSNGGSAVANQTIEENDFIVEPEDPSRDGYIFVFWYLDDASVQFNFSTAVTANLTLNAKWEEEADPIEEKTNEEKIAEDMAAVEENLQSGSRYELNLPLEGPIHQSTIRWTITSNYISAAGVVLPLIPGDTTETGKVSARFTLNGTVVNKAYDIELSGENEVEIAVVRTVPFINLTTEYNVDNKTVELLFEENGSVPYIRVQDFFELVTGFIDPEFDMTFTTDETSIFIQYFYYDEEEDHTYDLNLTIDTIENTFVTPDPGFYFAYVYSTATNYGRHINYARDLGDEYYIEGDDLVYDLDQYNMDAVMYEGDVVIPYYIANQLFAGSSYYNVYYNYDGLYGIYSLPGKTSDEFATIKESTKNQTTLPADLVAHTFNFLAFSLDNFYGLQEIKNVDSYYNNLFSIKNALLTKDASAFENGLFNFLNKMLDEPHTSYGYAGYYTNKTYGGPQLTLNSLGTRVRSFYEDGLYAVDDAIGVRWGITSSPTGWLSDSELRPKYWFVDEDKTAVVLVLDGFVTSNIEEDSIWNGDYVASYLKLDSFDNLIPSLAGGSKYFYFDDSTTTEDIFQVLIKGLDQSEFDAFVGNLLSNGFNYNSNYDVYTKNVLGKTLILRANYDETFEALAVGLTFDQTVGENSLLEEAFDLIDSDSAIYMEFMMDIITGQAPNLSHIFLDLTFNTGGNIGALYRVVGFVTKDPFKVSSIDGDTNSKNSSFVYIDGVPNYDHLQWGLLTSAASFSAANSLATIFQDNNLGPIVGFTTGGGASSITPILLPTGSAFTMSSNNINASVTGSGAEEDPFIYHSVEYGVNPTHPASSLIVLYSSSFLLSVIESIDSAE